MNHPLLRPSTGSERAYTFDTSATAAPSELPETFAAPFPDIDESAIGEGAVSQTADPQRDAAQGQTEDASPTILLFEAYHQTLKHDYRDESGNVIDCRDVALSIWKQLRNEGRHSRIVTLYGKNSHGNRTMLFPTPYEGKEWAWHAICDEAGVVYDPILEKPTAMETYLATVFHQEVEIEDRLPL